MLKREKIICLFSFAIIFFLSFLPIHSNASESSAPVKMKKGELIFKTTDTKATSSITWSTVGFTITREPCLDGAKANGGYPTKLQHAAIILDPKWKEERISGDTVIVTFTIPKKVVDKALIDAGFDGIKPNDIIYLHGIFQVLHSGKNYGNKIYDLPTIMKAEAWRNPDDFRDRFDLKVPFAAADSEPIAVEYKTSAGATISKKTLPESEWIKLGETVKYDLDKELTYKGKKYVLYKSYIRYMAIEKPIPDTGYSKTEGNTDLEIANRVIKQKNGGVEFVGIMKLKSKPPPDTPDETKVELEEPEPYGVIAADTRGNEKFDVLEGIPTTEDLYTNVISSNYLLGYQYTKVTGKKQYSVTVQKTYHLSWSTTGWDSEGNLHSYPASDTEMVSEVVTVTRDYSYWMVTNIDYFGIEKAEIGNYALPSGKVTLFPSGYTIPSLTYVHSEKETDHLKDPVYKKSITLSSQSISGGSSRPSIPSENFASYAESEVKDIKVKNDTLTFDGKITMNGAWKEKDTEAPKEIDLELDDIGENVLFKSALNIAAAKKNGINETKGTITYKRKTGLNPEYNASLTYNVFGLNDVVIHTPTVCNTSVSELSGYNQMIEPDRARASLVLDRSFSVAFPTEGDHRYILGYGYKDYSKYIESRQLQFPFDVYQGSIYIKANTWIPISSDYTTFYLPIWVKEGKYTISSKTASINAVTGGYNQTETLANLSLDHYVATDSIQVEVSGRIYGLYLYDISDYPTWEKVFRKPNSLKLTGFRYKIGDKDQNGSSNGQNAKYTFPLLNGVHPAYSTVGAIKPGYVTRFSLTTIGNMDSDKDYIRMKPTFYYVSYDGKNRQEVDLYYSETFSGKKNLLVKMGSDLDKTNKKALRFGDPYLSVPAVDIKNTAVAKGIPEKELKAAKKNVFTYTNIMIPYQMQTLIGFGYHSSLGLGTPSGISSTTIAQSMQNWYCEYYIPSETYAVPKDYNVMKYAKEQGIDYKESFWLKDGYIIINFDIETVQEGARHLSYINADNEVYGYCNMWKKEGFLYQKKDNKGKEFSLKNGDFLFYYADSKNHSAANDYRFGGTH